MRRLNLYFTALTLLCSSLAPAQEPINFIVATMEDSSGEGPERNRPYFMMGSQRIAFAQPSKSTVSADPSKLVLSFADRGWLGEIQVTNSRLKPKQDFLAETEAYFQEGARRIPPEAQEVEFKGANSHAYAVNEWKCQVFEWTYRLYGRSYFRQVAFINIDEEHQVSLTVVCPQEESNGLLPLARRFMSSWYFASSIPKEYIK